MRNHRLIVLDIQLDYLLKNIKPHIFYRIALAIDKEERRYFYFFILNGNIYFKNSVYRNDMNNVEEYYCCSIEKFKRFIAKANISQFFKFKGKNELETVNDLYIMIMECGYKREIDHNDFDEAMDELKSDFSNWHKFDEFIFRTQALDPRHPPGDALIRQSHYGTVITLDMISDRRKQAIPDCIKEEVIYWTNTMLDEKLVDINSVLFLLHAEIEFEVIGTLYKNYIINIIMVDKKGNQLHKDRFCLCDCEKEQQDAMEEYFKNELFTDKKF